MFHEDPVRPVLRHRTCLVAVGMTLYLTFAGCNSGSKSLLEADPEAVPATPTYEMVQAILDRSCAPCHHSGGGDRPARLAPLEDDYDYSTCRGVVSGLGGVFDTAIHGSSMPPGAWPRLTSEEKLLIERWADQGACGPCRSCP